MGNAEPSPSVLAIDGGGTYCRFVLLAGGERHEWEGGSANVSSDFDAAVAVVLEGADALADRTGQAPEAIHALPAYLGLAGVTGPAMAARLQAALPFANAIYTDDRPTVLRGALGRRDGAIAHCGTGSFFASSLDGEHRFAGGWGPVLGDEASAQWLGRRLLSATLETVDGLRTATVLTDAVIARFNDAPGIVHFAGTAEPDDFGRLAPLVTDSMVSDDATGLALMREGALHIEETLRSVGWRPGLTLCLTGGLAPHYTRFLPEEMQACVTAAQAEPIEGAVALALEHAERGST
jgi:glucosamine kinase